MESALTPREIQARIRGGESAADVSEAAGVPVEKIEVYAGPVIAEREHIAVQARTSQVRRRGESSTQRLLGDVVADALEHRGVPAERIVWDAWRDEDRRWTVQASWSVDETPHAGQFDFDPRGRYSTAADDEARVLINERAPAARRPGDPDTEPTIDLNDELAIVRVVQDETGPPAVLPDVPAARIIKLPGAAQGPVDDAEPEDYSPAELEQVDGIYDIIPNPHSDMDVLYDMLAGFNEDSVRIYAGLTQPVSPAPEPDHPTQPEDLPPADPIDGQSTAADRRRRPRNTKPTPPALPTPALPASASPIRDQATAPAGESASKVPDEAVVHRPPAQPGGHRQPTKSAESSQIAKPVSVAQARPSAAEPDQDALVGEPEPAPRPVKRRKRASVPTWDEIVFGGPTPPK